jgi:branched-chain amino acid transport system permease protein
MFEKLLSGDYPRSKVLNVALIVVFLYLLACPFLIEIMGVQRSLLAMNSAVKILVFIMVAASYDLLLGYTAILSFAHTVFFAIGAWSVAIFMNKLPVNLFVLILAIVTAVVVSVIVAFLMGLLGLRVKSLFFTMITLALAAGFHHIIVHASGLTGGLDGITFQVPSFLTARFLIRPEGKDLELQGLMYILYYIIFVISTVSFLAMLRLANSPFGRVLQAIRENEFRTLAIGFKPIVYRIIVLCIGCGVCAVGGALYAIWLRAAVPNTFLSLDIMISILIMVVIGGMGTLYGSILGAVIMVMIESYLRSVLVNSVGADGIASPDLIAVLGNNFFGQSINGIVDFLCRLTSPDRWNMYMGLFFVLVVYFFSMGLVGAFRILEFNLKLKRMAKKPAQA